VKNAAVTLYNNKALLSWDNPNSSVQYVGVYRDDVYLGTSPSTIFIDNPIDDGALGNKTDGINVELKNVQPVRMIEVKTDKNSPQPVKSSITLDALAEGGNERLYKFWVFENGIWRVLQDYSAANSATWTPLLEGTYKISVHVKDKESSKSYDDYKAFKFKRECESVLLNSLQAR
jgi:Y_Y_Y domain